MAMAQFLSLLRFFIVGFLISTAGSIPAGAQTFDTPPSIPLSFQEGDVISANVFNSLLSRINNVSKLPTAPMLIGTWNCKETRGGGSGLGGNFVADVSGLFGTRENIYTIVAGSSQNTLRISTSAGYPLRYDPKPWVNVLIGIAPNTRILTADVNIPPTYNMKDDYIITAIGNDRFELSEVAQGNSGTCYKISTPPSPADGLTVIVSGSSADLTWTDQSTTETGFKIQQKISMKGNWSTVATTAANATSYTVTGLSPGTYWFRVLATNANGDSITSSEVQAKVQ